MSLNVRWWLTGRETSTCGMSPANTRTRTHAQWIWNEPFQMINNYNTTKSSQSKNVLKTKKTSHPDTEACNHLDVKVTDSALSAVTHSPVHTYTDTHVQHRKASATSSYWCCATASHTLLIWGSIRITGAVVQAITWEKRDDPLLWVFLPSLNWELVEYLHLRKGEGKNSLMG